MAAVFPRTPAGINPNIPAQNFLGTGVLVVGARLQSQRPLPRAPLRRAFHRKIEALEGPPSNSSRNEFVPDGPESPIVPPKCPVFVNSFRDVGRTAFQPFARPNTTRPFNGSPTTARLAIAHRLNVAVKPVHSPSYRPAASASLNCDRSSQEAP